MTQQEFWNLIETARSSGFEYGDLRNLLKSLLETNSDSDLIDFTNIYHQYVDDLYSWKIWNAITLINGGMGEDNFFYFRDFLVSRGREHYSRILNDPESLIDDELDPELHDWPFAEIHFRTVGIEVFEKRNDKEFPWSHQWTELSGKSIDYENEDEVRSAYPRIWKHLQDIIRSRENLK